MWVTKWTRDASALRWRPERGPASFRSVVGFLRLSNPVLFVYFFQLHPYSKWSFFRNFFPLVHTLGLCVYKGLLMYTSLYTLGVFINFHSWEGPSYSTSLFLVYFYFWNGSYQAHSCVGQVCWRGGGGSCRKYPHWEGGGGEPSLGFPLSEDPPWGSPWVRDPPWGSPWMMLVWNVSECNRLGIQHLACSHCQGKCPISCFCTPTPLQVLHLYTRYFRQWLPLPWRPFTS